MDQRVVVGDRQHLRERGALARGGRSLAAGAHASTTDEVAALHAGIVGVLTESIAARGTRFRDYRDASGGTRRLRALARGVRTRRRALPPLRRAAGRDPRDRRTDHGVVRALSKVKPLLLTPTSRRAGRQRCAPTSRATAKDRPGVYRMALGRRRDRVRRQVEAGAHAAAQLLPLRAPTRRARASCARRRRIEWEYMPSEFAALLEELRLIKRFRPRLNVAMKRDARHFAFIKLTRGAGAQAARGARRRRRRRADLLRSVPRRAARERGGARAQRRARPARLPASTSRCTSPTSRSCSRSSRARRAASATRSGSASAPASAAAPSSEYDEPRRGWCAPSSTGRDDGPMETLRARDGGGERARSSSSAPASLRDKLQRLEGLREQFIRFRFAVETLSFVYTVPGHEGDDRVYLIRRGRVRAELRHAAQRAGPHRACCAMVDDVFNPAERDTAQVPSHEIDELLLLSSWFRRFPAELERSSAAAAFVASQRRRRRASQTELARLLHIRRADVRFTGGGAPRHAMTTTWQPTTLVQCISVKPWLTYPRLRRARRLPRPHARPHLRDARRRGERIVLPDHRRLGRGLPVSGVALQGRLTVILPDQARCQ